MRSERLGAGPAGGWGLGAGAPHTPRVHVPCSQPPRCCPKGVGARGRWLRAAGGECFSVGPTLAWRGGRARGSRGPSSLALQPSSVVGSHESLQAASPRAGEVGVTKRVERGWPGRGASANLRTPCKATGARNVPLFAPDCITPRFRVAP